MPGVHVSRVPALALASVDWRVALFAALIAAAAGLTALQTLAYARDCTGNKRLGWLLLTGASAAAGIWATHFLTIRAYQWPVQVSYDPTVVGAAFLVAITAATCGFAIASTGDRMHAVAGGAVVGMGLVLTHVAGMNALSLPAAMHRTPLLAVPVHVLAVALCSTALAAHRELSGRRALWAATGLLTFATCALHFVAVGGLTVTPDPSMPVSAFSIDGSTLSILVACVTAFIMLAGRTATLMAALSSRDVEIDLRQRHQALQQREAELSRQNVLFDVALSSLPHGLCIVDADRRLVVCNKRYADMYGIPGELTKPGTPMSTIVDHRIAAGIYAHPDAQAYRDELLGPVTKATVKTHHLSGGRYVLVSRRPMPEGGWIAVHEDITERRRLQETEREAKETLAAIFDAVPEAIVCVAADRRVMLWSRGAELIFGYTAEETVGQPFKLVPPDGKAEFDEVFERALAGETLRDVRAVRWRKDGSLVDISFSSAALRDRDGTVRGIVYALDDLTEWEQLAARLEAQNELLKQREEKLKTQNEQLDTALARMVQGLAMFDAEERLILANARYAELFGLSTEQVKPGTTLGEIVALRCANGFYPGMSVDEVLRGMRERNGGKAPTHLVRKSADGRVLSVSVQPRADGGWVTTLHDISEQESLKGRLQEQNEQLDAALNNMSQGLAMFDAEQRLVVSNRRFAEMYGLAPVQTVPGITVRQIIEAQFASGLYEAAADVDQMVAQFGRQPVETHRLADGRVINVTYQRTANGGYVVTHKEAGARERLNAQLEQQHRLLKEHEKTLQARNNQLDATINNMPQGLAMFDAEQRLIVCNKLYAEMYGLTPEQVKPGTTVREIFDYRMANGFYHVKDTEQFVDSWASSFGKRSSRIQELADGRIVSVSRSQTADGGRVVTHEDITERQKLNAQLGHQHQLLKAQEERLRAQNVQLDAALNNMVQGLAMFDAEHRVVIANNRYAELYNLTPDDVKPGTLLRDIVARRIALGQLPGRSADEILQSMINRVSGKASQYTTRLHDGRYIVVSAKPHGRRLHRHHPSGHHRAAPLRGQDRAHGAARCVDRVAQSRPVQRAAGARPGAGQAWRGRRRPSARPRPLQARQRHPGPSCRRQAAEGRHGASAHAGARDGYRRPHGRRRVRHCAGSDRAPGGRRRAGAPRHRRREPALRDRRPPSHHRRQRRHRRGADGRRLHRPADA